MKVFKQIQQLNLSLATSRLQYGTQSGWSCLRQDFEVVGFHWSQAVERQIAQHGLIPAYKESAGPVRNVLRQLLHLPYLPASTVEDAFNALEEKASTLPDARLMDLFDYVKTTWLNSSIWTIETWCLHYREIRTNNDVEGWHSGLNSQGKCQTNTVPSGSSVAPRSQPT